jgi:formylglycine-generating enzyme required for sulfatase activity
VRRLGEDLSANAPARERRQALEQVAALAASGGVEAQAVEQEGAQPLVNLLGAAEAPEADRQDAALVLGLIGAEQPLQDCLGDTEAPVSVRQRAAESLGLLARRSSDRIQRDAIARELEGALRSDALNLLVADEEGWAEHDRRLPPLQGASRALQLAASADLPLLGSGPGRLVPMLTLTALQEGEALRIRTEVVTPAVWRLPVPEWPGEASQQLELVVVPGGEYKIGSAEKEAGRDVYTQIRQKCEGVNVEAERKVSLKPYAMLRNPLSQALWRAVAALPSLERDISPTPGTYEAKGLWESYAEPGGLAVDSVSWYDCQEWLQRLNLWLKEQWPELGDQGEAPQLALPSESQWEAACRAGGSTPFHFGDTLDASWVNYDASYTYGPGRKGGYRQRPVPMSFFGLVNRWGLAEMHGELLEWCADQWHRSPIREDLGQRRGWFGGGGRRQELLDGRAVEGPDRGLADVPQQQQMRLLRGGSWLDYPHFARAAFRFSGSPDNVYANVGVRPGCFSPPGSLLGS